MLKRFIVGVMLIASAMQFSGCFALFVGAAAASGVIWVKGKLVQTVNGSVDKAHGAAISALKKLGLPVITDKKDSMTSRIESEYSDGKHVWIDIDYSSKTTTKIAVRVGTMGDEIRSHEIMDLIQKNF